MVSAEELVFVVGVAVTVATVAAVGAALRATKSKRAAERTRHDREHLEMQKEYIDLTRRLDHRIANSDQIVQMMRETQTAHDEALLELMHLQADIDPEARERMLRRRPDLRRRWVDRLPEELPRGHRSSRSVQED